MRPRGSLRRAPGAGRTRPCGCPSAGAWRRPGVWPSARSVCRGVKRKKENENGTGRKAGTESRVSKLRHAADGREIVRNERRRQSESGLLRVLLPERRLRTVVYDGRDDRALRRHAGTSERGFGDEHYARRIRCLHAGSIPETEALEAGVRPITGRHVPATGRRSGGKGRCGPVSGAGGPGEEPAVANRIGAGTGRIFSAASVGGQTVCRPAARSGKRRSPERQLPSVPDFAVDCGRGGAVRRHVPAGAVDVRTKPNRAAVKDSGPIRFRFYGYVRPFGIFCRQDGKTSGGRSLFSEFFPERAGNVISPATSSRDGCSV